MTNMIDNAAINTVPASGWQLRVELSATSSPRDDRKLAHSMSEALREVGLQSPQRDLIQKVVLEAAQRVSLHVQPSEPVSPVRVRIWTALDCACGRGSEFFLVEKRGSERQGATVKTESMAELFLYQEPRT